MKRLASLLLIFSIFALPGVAAERRSRWRTIWHVSQAMLVSANAADIASSWGRYELNPLVRTGQRFGYASAGIKLGTVAGCLLAQHYLIHKTPSQYRYAAVANFAGAAVLGAAAIHNVRTN